MASEQKVKKFELNKETIRELDIDELELAEGGFASNSCCIGCNTDNTTTWCSQQGKSC